MTKRILVPLDGSQLAEVALPHAIAMAHANLYGLALVRVFPPPVAVNSIAWAIPPSADVWEGAEEEMTAEADYLNKVAARLGAKGVDVITQLVEDDPASGIISYVLNHPEVSMIVMSTHGRGGIGRWVLGSVAERVLHVSPVPVLLVRSQEEDVATVELAPPVYDSLLVPLDGSEFAASALSYAQTLASIFKAKIALVSAVPESPIIAEALTPPIVATELEGQRGDVEAQRLEAYLTHQAALLKQKGLLVTTDLEYCQPPEAILKAADKADADLIVMATHGRTGLPRLLLGSVAMRVVQTSHRPVFLVRPPATGELVLADESMEEAGV